MLDCIQNIVGFGISVVCALVECIHYLFLDLPSSLKLNSECCRSLKVVCSLGKDWFAVMLKA